MVIGILAAITIVSFNGVTKRAQEAKITEDLSQLDKAVTIARESTMKVMGQVTGSFSTGSGCSGKPSGTDLAALNKATDSCWTIYERTLANITAASGINVENLVDPWGRPYLIDENEGEGSNTNCTRDSIAVYTQPFTGGWTTYPTTPANNFPRSGYLGCTPG